MKFLYAVKARPGGSGAEIANASGIDTAVVNRTLARLAERGAVENDTRDGTVCWKISDSGDELLSEVTVPEPPSPLVRVGCVLFAIVMAASAIFAFLHPETPPRAAAIDKAVASALATRLPNLADAVSASLSKARARCGQGGLLTQGCPGVVPIVFSSGWEGRIEFDAITAVEGLWDGSGGEVVIERPRLKLKGESRSETWGDTLGGGAVEADPWIEVKLPPLARRHLHKTLAALARLDVSYPQPVEAVEFTNESAALTRSIRFVTLTEAEAAVVAEVLIDESPDTTVTGRNWFLIVGGAISALVALWIAVYWTWFRPERDRASE